MGSTVITCPEIVASNAMSVPLASVSLSVIKASTLSSVSAVSSSSRTASLKVIVMLLVLATSVAPSVGTIVTVGAVVS